MASDACYLAIIAGSESECGAAESDAERGTARFS